MAIWHSSETHPGYKALVTITKKGLHNGSIVFDNVSFEGSDTGEVINKVDNYIDKYFALLNKENYIVHVNLMSYTNYELQI